MKKNENVVFTYANTFALLTFQNKWKKNEKNKRLLCNFNLLNITDVN